MVTQKILGLALSGGGARGLAHIGVLKVLEENNINISFISGCSMGGLVGSLYALGFPINEIEEIAKKYTSLREMINLVDRSPSRRGLIVGHRLRNLLSKWIDNEAKFSSTKIPLALNAVDLISSQEIVLKEGSILDAVMSTIAIPGFFAPVNINGMQLVDGGTLNNLPVSNLQQFNPDVTLAVDVHPELKNEPPLQFLQSKPRFFSVVPEFFLDFYRAELIMVSKLTDINLLTNKPSLLIRPALPPEITMFYGYQNASKIIESGEESARNALPKIKELLF